MTRLLIIQPYIPDYRRTFFKQLKTSLDSIGVEMTVAAGRAVGDQASRDDDSTENDADWLLRERHFVVGHSRLTIRRIGQVLSEFQPNLIVVEQAVKNLESWKLLMSASRRSRVGLWGHGALYSQNSHALWQPLRKLQLRSADWFYVYTPGGARYLMANGYPVDRTTVLYNSTDTVRLRNDINDVSAEQRQSLRTMHDLTPGHTALFVGGIDRRKGIDFLLRAASIVAKDVPQFRLLVGGAGSEVSSVLAAQAADPTVRYLGPLKGTRKASVLAVSDFIVLPEWVGLAAVDALAAGIPVVTTDHTSHAPEFEYLSEGETALVATHDVGAYSNLIADLMHDRELQDRMRSASLAYGQKYSIEKMVHNFTAGVQQWLQSPR